VNINVSGLDENKFVGTDENKNLISVDAPSGAQTLQETYDTSIADPTIVTTVPISIYNSINNNTNTLEVLNSSGTTAVITLDGDGVVNTKGLIINGTENSLQLESLTPAQVVILNSNLGSIESKSVVYFNEGSQTIDFLQSGNIYNTQKDILACPVYDMRFSIQMVTGTTYFQKLFCPHTSIISNIDYF